MRRITHQANAHPNEIAPGVHRVPGVRGANAYLVATGDGRLALIDSGLPGSARRVLSAIAAIGGRQEDLRVVLLTHGHPDHIGSAKTIAETTGARVLIHAADTREVGTQMFARCPGLPHALALPPWRVPIDGFLEDGQEIGRLRVIHTPGHTPGGISLLLKGPGVLFTGDLLTQRGRYVSRSVPFPGSDLNHYHTSLGRISGIEARVACFGHGEPLHTDVADILRGAADWYRNAPRLRRLLQREPGPLRPGINIGYRYR